MAGDSKKLQPIIIKRVRKGGHGKHGGAWKIAYADFVTAMMAFFLLMWLLGSTTEGDKKGIADFFNAPLKVALYGGSGAGGRRMDRCPKRLAGRAHNRQWPQGQSHRIHGKERGENGRIERGAGDRPWRTGLAPRASPLSRRRTSCRKSQAHARWALG